MTGVMLLILLIVVAQEQKQEHPFSQVNLIITNTTGYRARKLVPLIC